MDLFAKLMRSCGEDGDQQRKKKLPAVGLNQNDYKYVESEWVQDITSMSKRSTLFPRVCTCNLATSCQSPHARFWERPSSLRRRNWPWRFGLRANGSIWDRLLMNFDNKTIPILITSNRNPSNKWSTGSNTLDIKTYQTLSNYQIRTRQLQ